MYPEQPAFKESRYLEAIIDTSDDGILVVDADGRFEFGNNAFFRISGWQPDALIGESFLKVIPEDLVDFMTSRWQEVQRGEGMPYETEILTADGTRVPLKVTHRHMTMDGRRKYCVIVHDNTEQKARERELETYRQHLEERVASRTAALTRINDQLRATIKERERAETYLQESEANFRAIAENANEGIMISDAEHNILYANVYCGTALGYGTHELLQMRTMDIIVPRDRLGMAALADAMREGKPVEWPRETVVVTKQGKDIHVEFTGAVTQWRGREAILSMIRDITLRRQMEQEILHISHMERQRIGQDFHDTLGQQLTGVAFMLKAHERTLEAEASHHAAGSRKIGELVSKSISVARHIARGLSPVDVPQEGLAHALNLLADDTREMCEVACTFTDRGSVAVEDNSTATHVYRIAQEAVNNAVKHGRPSRINIELSTTDSRGILRVTNDGEALIPDHALGRGLGTRIMQHRASVIGGSLQLEPAEGGGICLSCTFANPQRNHAPADTTIE